MTLRPHAVPPPPCGVAAPQGAQSGARGGPFALVNGALASDALVVVVPPGATLEVPLYLLNLSTTAASAGEGGRVW